MRFGHRHREDRRIGHVGVQASRTARSRRPRSRPSASSRRGSARTRRCRRAARSRAAGRRPSTSSTSPSASSHVAAVLRGVDDRSARHRMPRRGVRRPIRPRGRCRPTTRPPRTAPARRRRSRRATWSRRGCRASPPRAAAAGGSSSSRSGAAGAADAHAASSAATASAASAVDAIRVMIGVRIRLPPSVRGRRSRRPARDLVDRRSAPLVAPSSGGRGGLAHLLDESDDLREVASVRGDQQAREERHDARGDAQGELHDRRQPVRGELHAVRGAEAERREDHGPHDRARGCRRRARRCPTVAK